LFLSGNDKFKKGGGIARSKQNGAARGIKNKLNLLFDLGIG